MGSRFDDKGKRRRVALLAVAAIGVVVGAYVLGTVSSRHPSTSSAPATTTTTTASTATSPAIAAGSTTTSGPSPNECTHPNFKTSSHEGGATYGHYYVTNNMWNPLSVHQTLHVCNYDRWYVTSNMTSQGGAVQTYPNAQMTFRQRPALDAFTSVHSSFADATEPSGPGFDYEYAYDIWINGYGGNGTSELMIWNHTNGQSAGGNPVAWLTDGGHRYRVYLGGSPAAGDYIAFVATSNFTSGTIDLARFWRYAVAKHWIKGGSSAKLWQVDYGVEIASTGGHPAKFGVADFSVDPVRAPEGSSP